MPVTETVRRAVWLPGQVSRVIYSLSVSLDGYVESATGSIDWTSPDDELHAFFNDETRGMGTLLHGRRTYELMASYWPTADQDPSAPATRADFARIWRETPKVVFSRTLDAVAWNSRLVREGAVEEVARLKQQPGNDMMVGGATLASTLIRHDLVDEFRLFLVPVVLGRGKPYFPGLDRQIEVRLVETRTFGSRVVYLRYERE
jgi:dihydrofolate reductase